jgi:hypothetical protein
MSDKISPVVDVKSIDSTQINEPSPANSNKSEPFPSLDNKPTNSTQSDEPSPAVANKSVNSTQSNEGQVLVPGALHTFAKVSIVLYYPIATSCNLSLIVKECDAFGILKECKAYETLLAKFAKANDGPFKVTLDDVVSCTRMRPREAEIVKVLKITAPTGHWHNELSRSPSLCKFFTGQFSPFTNIKRVHFRAIEYMENGAEAIRFMTQFPFWLMDDYLKSIEKKVGVKAMLRSEATVEEEEEEKREETEDAEGTDAGNESDIGYGTDASGL